MRSRARVSKKNKMQLDAFGNEFWRCINAVRCVKSYTQLGAYTKCSEFSQCSHYIYVDLTQHMCFISKIDRKWATKNHIGVVNRPFALIVISSCNHKDKHIAKESGTVCGTN